MNNILIKNGHILSPADNLDLTGDILIENGIIKELGKELQTPDPGRFEIFDAGSFYISPGFVDVHTHFRDPGETDKEDIHSGALAAEAGGYTTVICMANTIPAVDSLETLKYIRSKAEKERIRILQCAAVTKERKGRELNDFKALSSAGAIGFTDDGSPLMDEDLVKCAMREAASLNKVLSFHEEDPEFIGVAGINNGEASKALGLKGADRRAEISMAERDIRLAFETGCKIDIQHVSAAETVELIREAKKRDEKGLINAEATPNHFSLTESAVLKYGALAKINPPLRTEEDRRAIIRGLRDGTINIIATDHAPHKKTDKEGEFKNCKSGITGLETAFSLGLKNLVNTGELTLSQLIERMSVNPASLYDLDAGHIVPGKKAELVIFSTEENTTYSSFHGKSQNSPFLNESLPGKIIKTISFTNAVK